MSPLFACARVSFARAGRAGLLAALSLLAGPAALRAQTAAPSPTPGAAPSGAPGAVLSAPAEARPLLGFEQAASVATPRPL